MDRLFILENLKISIDREVVLRHISCFPDSPVYEAMLDTYDEILPELIALSKPCGVISSGVIPAYCQLEEDAVELPAIFALATIGDGMSAFSTQAFRDGRYDEGLLADAIADAALFSLSGQVNDALRMYCAAHKCGIVRRMEAPQDLSMQIQKEAVRQSGANDLFGITVSSGMMLDPVKTSCSVYVSTPDPAVFNTQHNCRSCGNRSCIYRNIQPLTVTIHWSDGEEQSVLVSDEQTILNILKTCRPALSAPCGGNGNCGKCRIRVLQGKLPITSEDRAVFTADELREGWRLSCKAWPVEDVRIEAALQSEENISVLTAVPNQPASTTSAGYTFAIDIGTTTVAVTLQDLEQGKAKTETFLNPQRSFGADVISRIQAAGQGHADAMKNAILDRLFEAMQALSAKENVDPEKITRIVITANTTMLHLLQGLPCDGLGHTPFTPYSIDSVKTTANRLFPALSDATELLIMPGMAAFVGADITADAYALDLLHGDSLRLLVDLGTNGEMLLTDGHHTMATATAAGPAFEGGNISCGTGSIPGAICAAAFVDGTLHCSTIADAPAIGLCGSGLVSIIAELAAQEIIDETGRLEDDYFDDGFPLDDVGKLRLTQKDIREFQLAKAAIRAGIEALTARFGVSPEQIDTVYIAGGFGHALDYEKAIEIGMFPPRFAGKIKPVGNAALGGAQRLAAAPEDLRTLETFARTAEIIDLGTDTVFQNAYMDSMLFLQE